MLHFVKYKSHVTSTKFLYPITTCTHNTYFVELEYFQLLKGVRNFAAVVIDFLFSLL